MTDHTVKTRLIDTVGALDLHESTGGNLYVTAITFITAPTEEMAQ